MQDFLAIHWLDILTTTLGLIYIILEYRASIALWIVGIIMPAIDIALFWEHGLYADFGMAIYYTFAAAYGYMAWKFGRKHNHEPLPITHIKRNQILPALAVFLAAWLFMYEVLSHFTNSNVPITDSFGNALSVIGLWSLARKHVEQWIVWIIVDGVLSALYIQKGIPFKAGLYALYVVIAVMGYFKWKKIMAKQQSKTK